MTKMVQSVRNFSYKWLKEINNGDKVLKVHTNDRTRNSGF